MKNKILIYTVLLTAFAGLFSCELDNEKVMLRADVEANELMPLPADSYVLTMDEGENNFGEFKWTTVDFGVSAPVNYTLQVDAAGGDFAEAVNLATTDNLSITLTNSAVNDALLSLGLEPEQAAPVEFRVVASISENAEPVNSSVLQVSVTPYEIVFPPIYIIGDAQSWVLESAVELKSTGPGRYEGIASFVKDGKFRFFKQPSWDAEQLGYSTFSGGAIDDELADGADGDSNFLFAGESGVYTISVSVNDKSIVLEPAEEPELYVVGDDQGWVLANAFKLTWLGGGKYKGTTDFTEGSIFRFFTAPDWTATQYNYNTFLEGTVDEAHLSGVTEGDANFTFVGTTGTYTVMVDLYNLKVEVSQ